MTATILDTEHFVDLRAAIREAREENEPRPDEVSADKGEVIRCDEAARAMLDAVPSLQLESPYELRAAVYLDPNGWGRVWTSGETDSVPMGHFLDPEELKTDRETIFDSVMSVHEPANNIDNAGGPAEEALLQAYADAALLGFEYAAFGARWHSVGWGHHDIKTDWPPPEIHESDWTLISPQYGPDAGPVSARRHDDGSIEVTIGTRSDLSTAAIYIHEITFPDPESLAADVSSYRVAEGPEGFVP